MSVSQYILEEKELYRLQVRLRNLWLTRIRWYYVLALTSITIIASIVSGGDPNLRNFAVRLAIVGVTLNGILWLLMRVKTQSVRYYKSIAVGHILLDLGMASSIIYFQGGIASRGTVLYAIPILATGILFSQSYAYLAAGLSGIFYGLTLTYYEYVHRTSYNLHFTVVPIAFYAAVFFVIAIMVSRFSMSNAVDIRQKSYGGLLAMMRHQLHQPTGVIAALVEMLEHSKLYPTWSKEDKVYLRQLKRENARLNTMVTNLIESVEPSDKDKDSNHELDLLPLLNDITVSCASATKRMDDLRTNFPNAPVKTTGRTHQLRTAFDNVIDNAFRYSPAGTPVTVTLKQQGNKALVVVEDKGPGMSTTQQRLLFKLFSKLENTAIGNDQETEQLYAMGLGLYVSKLIIERHGGSLELLSKPKEGTRVEITV